MFNSMPRKNVNAASIRTQHLDILESYRNDYYQKHLTMATQQRKRKLNLNLDNNENYRFSQDSRGFTSGSTSRGLTAGSINPARTMDSAVQPRNFDCSSSGHTAGIPEEPNYPNKRIKFR